MKPRKNISFPRRKKVSWNYRTDEVGEDLAGISSEIKSVYSRLQAKRFDFTTQSEQTEALKGVLSMLKIYLKGRRASEQLANKNLMQMKVGEHHLLLVHEYGKEQ